MISQKDIAKALKVSPATVSKAFRNAPDIGSETRARILSEAAKLGYQTPVYQKTSGKSQSGEDESRFIGVFYCETDAALTRADHSSVRYLDGLSEAANFCNASLIVHRVTGGGRGLLSPGGQPPALRNGLLSGLVLVYRFDEDVVRRLAETMPVVTITHWVPEARCDHVDSDHISAMQRLVDHLKGLGHRRIGFVSPGCDYSYERSRFSSYVRAMVHAGLEIIPDAFVLNREKRCFSADDMASQIVARMDMGITAWMCDSDGVAHGVIGSLEERGISVPGQLSVSGFDEIHSPGPTRCLTTVKTPFWEMGITALERLMRRIDSPGIAPSQTLLDCALVEGETTASAPGASDLVRDENTVMTVT